MPRKPIIRKEFWPAAFIVFIMVFSAFGVMFYGFSNPSRKLDYGEYEFTVTDEGFVTELNGRRHLFQHFPADVEFINLSSSVIETLKATHMVYLTYNPNQSLVGEIAAAQFQFQQDLNEIGIYGATALTVHNEYDVPVVTCKNATAFVPVIEFRETDTISITDENNCILLQAARRDDFSRLKDRLLFGLLGIIK